MAEQSFRDLMARLRAAEQGSQELEEVLADINIRYAESPTEVIRTLRQLPSDDMSKKRRLAIFFQSEQGQRNSKDERRQAYDDLLGRERNREAR